MSTPREPLSPDAVDALLSAQLDGELDGAARELGLSESEALAELASTPGIDARRVALTRARDLIAARSPLEPAVEARLVAAAMARDDLALVRAPRAPRSPMARSGRGRLGGGGHRRRRRREHDATRHLVQRFEERPRAAVAERGHERRGGGQAEERCQLR